MKNRMDSMKRNKPSFVVILWLDQRIQKKEGTGFPSQAGE
jgi:hypothetical protein